MGYQLNQIVLQAYSKQFAEKYSTKVFATQSQITGEQLLNFCPIKQVNLLMLKQLFEYWKKSIDDSRVPYFNYQHPDVQAALQNYANLLSRNILVGKTAFYGLLEKSIFQTLMLVFKPYEFFIGELSRPQSAEIFKSQLLELKKYLYINKNLLSEFIQQLDTQNIEKLASKDMIGSFKVFYEKNQTLEEQVEPYIVEFDKLLACDMDLFLLQFDDIKVNDSTEPIIIAGEPTIISTSIFENLVQPSQQKTITETLEKDVEEIPVKIVPEQKPPQNIIIEKTPIVEPEEITMHNTQKPLGHSYYVDEKEDVSTKTDNNGQSIELPKRVHQVLPPVVKESNRPAIEITFGQRFSFITQLFDGDSEAFDGFIKQLTACQNFQETFSVIEGTYATKYNWNMEKTIFSELRNLLENHFLKE
jgi:hypothetical protein